MTLIDNTVKKKPVTHVVMVLDESSSMGNIREQAIAHFNEQIDDLRTKSAEHDIDVSLLTFSHDVHIQRKFAPIADVEKLTTAEYKPMGSTALYDAIGYGIGLVSQKIDLNDENTGVLFLIITDGHENTSREFTQASLKKSMDDYKTKGWTFTFMAANNDPMELAQNFGLNIQNVAVFNANEVGMAAATDMTSQGLGGYMKMRSAGIRSSSKFYEGTPGDVIDGNAELAKQGKNLVDSRV